MVGEQPLSSISVKLPRSRAFICRNTPSCLSWLKYVTIFGRRRSRTPEEGFCPAYPASIPSPPASGDSGYSRPPECRRVPAASVLFARIGRKFEINPIVSVILYFQRPDGERIRRPKQDSGPDKGRKTCRSSHRWHSESWSDHCSPRILPGFSRSPRNPDKAEAHWPDRPPDRSSIACTSGSR